MSTVDKQIFIDIFERIDFEKIIDHPNILIAANFWDADKYQAAKTCYKFMRYIDDLIDNFKSEHTTITDEEKVQLENDVNSWIATIFNKESNAATSELIQVIHRFHIPAWPLEAFARSMIYDIHNDGFPTLEAFLEYSKGASVAPAAIFVHLCGLRKSGNDYLLPEFDVREAATPCAVFSYLVHIIRDFVKDHTHNLNYFPDDLMQKYSLNRANLLEMARGAEITPGFRAMIAELYTAANEYRLKTLEVKERIKPMLEQRGQLSLEIIFALYTMVFDRIDVQHGTFTTPELNPTPNEIKQKVWTVIMEN